MPFVILDPGNLYIAWEPTIIYTLLGSCISIVLYLPESRVSAVCHSMLPNENTGGSAGPFRYVDSAIHYMMDSFRAHTLPTSSIQVKMFGGADMLDNINKASNTIGQQNIMAAINILKGYGLKIDSRKVGGIKSYKLYLRSDTGEVMLKNVVKKI